MEWQLPIQKMEISNIQIGSPWMHGEKIEKPIAPLSYFSPQFRMPVLSLLFPPLPIVDYSPQSGRLVLDIAETNLACIKLNTLQETLIAALAFHQAAWFKTSYTVQQIRAGFQLLLNGTHLHFHCFRDATDLQVGSRIRLAVKFHGLSFLMNSSGGWGGQCRLQHRVVGLIRMS